MVSLEHSNSFFKSRISFDSAGIQCLGYFYVPAGANEKIPCVVLANGFSGTMDWILPSFAERFALAGFAVLIFDYRHLGESGGKPRQLIDIKKQREDLRNAIQFARTYNGIDPDKIALWGTSLGGSHVIETAANDPSIALVIANMPALDAIRGANTKAKMQKANANTFELVKATGRLLVAATLDQCRAWAGLSPYYLDVYGPAGRAIFTDPSLAERFKLVAQKSPTWKNKVAARFLFHVPRYREGTMERIKVPLLIALAKEDVEISTAFVKEKAMKAPRAEIKEYPFDHFSMYHGEAFEQVVNDQVNFLHTNGREKRALINTNS